MTYTAPKTWTAEPLTSADMNTFIRDNQIALKDPPTDVIDVEEASDLTTTSTSTVDMDATNLKLSITTTGGDVLVGFSGSFNLSSVGHFIYLDIYESVGGADLFGDDGHIVSTAFTAAKMWHFGFVVCIEGLSAGTHEFKMRWKVSSGTGTFFRAAGTGSADVHPQFWAKEL